MSECLHLHGTKTNYCAFTVVVRDKNEDVIVFSITSVISYAEENMSNDASRNLKYRMEEIFTASPFISYIHIKMLLYDIIRSV